TWNFSVPTPAAVRFIRLVTAASGLGLVVLLLLAQPSFGGGEFPEALSEEDNFELPVVIRPQTREFSESEEEMQPAVEPDIPPSPLYESPTPATRMTV